MTPYYSQDGIDIYLGDCRDILPTFPDKSFDLVLTDPPYGILQHADWSKTGAKEERITGKKNQSGRNWGILEWDKEVDLEFLLHYGKWRIFWGGQFYAHVLPKSTKWLVFNKRGMGEPSGASFGDCEIAWTDFEGVSVRMFSQMWHGSTRWRNNPSLHPTQKSVELMRWCIELSPAADFILDPFMGSGTTLVAAKQLGRKAVGIEIEEKYCEIAVKRLAQMELFSDLAQAK